jgi:uncharacterized protein
MLIDINAHVGHWPFKQLKYNNCEALLQRMNKFGVDISVVTNLNGIFYKNTQSANEELYNEIISDKRFRNRLIPMAIINPLYADWRNDLKVCSTKMGMKGVRLDPKYHDYELTDPSCIEVVKYARDLGLAVALTMRIVDSRQRSWMDINKEWQLKDIVSIVREVPDARYLILNLANSIQVNDEDAVLLKKANLVFDTSGRSLDDLGSLIKEYGEYKFAFGTHSPILDYATGMLRVEALRESEANEEKKSLIRSGNAKRILYL